MRQMICTINVHVEAALFFHKIEAKNQGCSLSMDTSVFGVLKNLINIQKNFLRCQEINIKETESVLP